MITTLSSRAFNQDAGRAKKAALAGPVFITDRGKPAHVLLTIEEYQKVSGGGQNILDLLSMPEVKEADFTPQKVRGKLFRPATY
jgi:PHD/YefM family antitoxin component YafN of YafNO toxin-antitoxin module